MTDHPTIVFLHFLGGSARTWAPVIARLGDRIRPLPIDLPGWGDNAGEPGQTVAEMADFVQARLAQETLGPWLLAGHSMGAKIAAVLARRAEDGAPALAGLQGLVLVAGSPPGPEPMDEAKRDEMLGWFHAGPDTARQQAGGFIDGNVATKLPPALHEIAVEDVLRADKHRWRAWFAAGSKEDWSARVGILQTPTLILAGTEDPHLGPAGQAAAMAPHLAHHRQVDLPDAKHLLPIEQPNLVAGLIAEMLP